MYCLCLFLLYPFYATCDEKTSLSCLSISCFIHFRNMREGKEAQVVERNGLSFSTFSITTRYIARLEMLTFPQTRASKLKKNLKILKTGMDIRVSTNKLWILRLSANIEAKLNVSGY